MLKLEPATPLNNTWSTHLSLPDSNFYTLPTVRWNLCCWLLNFPAISSCISGRGLPRQFTCCHSGIEAVYQTFFLTQSQHTDTRPTSPSPDQIKPGTWQGSHWSVIFKVSGMTRHRKQPTAQQGIKSRASHVRWKIKRGQFGGWGERRGQKSRGGDWCLQMRPEI